LHPSFRYRRVQVRQNGGKWANSFNHVVADSRRL
jgi:hypothetical protein